MITDNVSRTGKEVSISTMFKAVSTQKAPLLFYCFTFLYYFFLNFAEIETGVKEKNFAFIT